MTAEERGFLVNARNRRLYYCFHGVPGATRGWVFCNPFLEEQIFSHTIYANLARRLAAQGDAVLRFDYEGDGDSEGDVTDVALEDWAQDIEAAAAFLRSRAGLEHVNLFGLRLGANLALLSAGITQARQLLLWDPIASGATYFQECLRINLTTQLAMYRKVVENREQMMARLHAGDTVNIQGYEVSGRLADGIAALHLPTLLAAAPCAVDVIRTNVRARASDASQPVSANARVRSSTIEGTAIWTENREYDPAPEALLRASLEAVARVRP